jgi:hypothetical protein
MEMRRGTNIVIVADTSRNLFKYSITGVVFNLDNSHLDIGHVIRYMALMDTHPHIYISRGNTHNHYKIFDFTTLLEILQVNIKIDLMVNPSFDRDNHIFGED